MEKLEKFWGYIKEAARMFFDKPETGNTWAGIAHLIPDFVGLVTLFAGGYIIITSLFGRKAFMKPVAFLAAFYIVMICILEVAT